jgi:hypothetical protein
MGFQFSSCFLVDGLKDNPCYITSPGSSNVDSIAHNNGVKKKNIQIKPNYFQVLNLMFLVAEQKIK